MNASDGFREPEPDREPADILALVVLRPPSVIVGVVGDLPRAPAVMGPLPPDDDHPLTAA